MAHTPGPWAVSSRPSGGERIFYVGEVGHEFGLEIATLYGAGSGAAQEANARLIAAAPDLYEALVMIRDADEDCRADGLPVIPSVARAAIDAAIAKAEGR